MFDPEPYVLGIISILALILGPPLIVIMVAARIFRWPGALAIIAYFAWLTFAAIGYMAILFLENLI